MMLPIVSAILWLVAAQATPPPAAATAPASVDAETLLRLPEIRRVYVDRFGGGETASQLRDMIISSLLGTKLFILSESEQRADAILRGSAEDLIFTDTYTSSDSLDARASASLGADPDKTASDRRSRGTALTVGEQDSSHTTERKHEATASVRLVSKDGDVLWSTTQESLGAKFRSASADVADKVSRQLVRDYELAKKLHNH
jgi:hypothetical protein